MAGQQPLESTKRDFMPGEFPETPAANDSQTFSVNPLPATAGAGNPISLAPGEKVPDPSTFTNNTVTSQVRDDPSLGSTDGGKDSEQAFGVSPIPATGGIGNPVQLAPGEKVPDPSTITGNTLTSNVKTDAASYEKSDSGAPVLPPALSPASQREAEGGDMFGLGPQTSNMIPESSLSMGGSAPLGATDTGPTISSAAPGSSTAQMAGQVPLEERGVPQVVSESEAQAGQGSEAAGNPEAVQEKSAVEQELMEKVPEEPSTSESGVPGKHEGRTAGIAAAGIAAAGAAVVGGTAYGMSDKAAPQDGESMATRSAEKAGTDPEAATNPEAVQEKSAMEEELKQKVPEEGTTSESGMLGKSEGGVGGLAAGGLAAAGATAAGTAYSMRDKGMPFLPDSVKNNLPESLKESTAETHGQEMAEESAQKAGTNPEASTNPEAVEDKSAVEDELKQRVPEEPATSESGTFGKSEKGVAGMAAGGVAAAGAAAAGTAYAMRDKATPYLPDSVQQSITNMNSSIDKTSPQPNVLDGGAGGVSDAELPQQTAAGQAPVVPAEEGAAHSAVPDLVTMSQREAHQAPEASGSREMVAEKSAMEKELMSEVKPSEESGAPAPTETAATSATAPGTGTEGLSPVSMSDDKPLESSTGLNAPASSQAQSEATKVGQLSTQEPEREDPSRDVSPMSKPITGGQSQPTVTTGTGSSSAPQTSGAAPPTPAKDTPSASTPQKQRPQSQMINTPDSQKTSSSAGDSKKSKRRSFFGRLKDKLK